MLARGCDVSHWQGKIDWEELAKHIDFVCIKATEDIYMDTMFLQYWREARRYGIPRFAYHFYRPDNTGEKQADNFYRIMKDNGYGEIPPMFDFESVPKLPKLPTVSYLDSAKRYCERITELMEVKPIIYTAKWYLYYFVYNRSRYQWMMNYDLWLAEYPWSYNWTQNYSMYYNKAVNGLYSPKTPWPWSEWSFWQWTGNGKEAGITTSLDMNVYKGTKEQLYARYGIKSYNGSKGMMLTQDKDKMR